MTTHAFDIDALNEICVSLGGNGGHRLQIDALNEWCSKAGKATGHTRSVAAYNALAGGTTYAFDLQAMNDLSGDLGGATNATNGIAALNAVADKVAVPAGPPAWVPADAKIHIDFIGGSPQGRAWVESTGEVGVATLLGNDPNADAGYGPTTGYNSADLTADGYARGNSINNPLSTAFIGVALIKLLAGATIRLTQKQVAVGTGTVAIFAADGSDGIQADIGGSSVPLSKISLSSWAGPLSKSTPSASIDGVIGALNGSALTVVGSRFEAAANGNTTCAVGVLAANDKPPGNPFVAAIFDYRNDRARVRSITLYDPVPIAQLPGLSV